MTAHRHTVEYWSRSGSLIGFGNLAKTLGHDPLPILKRFGIPAVVLEDPEVKIPYRSLCRILEACAEQWECPDFGLRLAEVQHLNILGPVGLVARLSDSVGDALKALRDHIGVHSNAFEMGFSGGRRPDGTVTVVYRSKCEDEPKRQLLEFAMAVTRNVMAFISGDAAFTPQKVWFACLAPPDLAARRRWFHSEVRYGMPETGLLFDGAILNAPTAIRDTAYAPVIKAYVAQLDRRAGADLVQTTQQLIASLLASGRCSHKAVAECLNLHPRTFQRRLEALGTSFSTVLDDYRHALALDLVRNNRIPLAQIADRLGYSDQSVFNQAFRRWTNGTPSQFRDSSAA